MQLQQQHWWEPLAFDVLLKGSCNSSIAESLWLFTDYYQTVATAAFKVSSGCNGLFPGSCNISMEGSLWLLITLLHSSCKSSMSGILPVFIGLWYLMDYSKAVAKAALQRASGCSLTTTRQLQQQHWRYPLAVMDYSQVVATAALEGASG